MVRECFYDIRAVLVQSCYHAYRLISTSDDTRTHLTIFTMLENVPF